MVKLHDSADALILTSNSGKASSLLEHKESSLPDEDLAESIEYRERSLTCKTSPNLFLEISKQQTR